MIINYPIELFADTSITNRLSSRYWVDNQPSLEVTYDDICEMLFQACPYVVKVARADGMVVSFNKNAECTVWCSKNTNGWWMNSNFPTNVVPRTNNLIQQFWAFALIEDAIAFKLIFG